MSSSPEPEHTAPTAQVRPVQDGNLAQDVFSHRRPRVTLPLRTNSTSLLTQALAASHREDPSTSRKENPQASSQLFQTLRPHFPASQEQWSPPHKSADKNPLTSSRMSTMDPSSKSTLRTTVSLGTSPTSSPTPFTFASCDNIASLLKDHGLRFNRPRGRGTSLERTEKEKRVQEIPKGTHSTNPGDTGMTTTPPPKISTDGDPISNNVPIEGPRAEYRSWRDARPNKPPNKPSEKAWSIGNQGGKDSQGGKGEKSVEKSIAEALAGVEHNTRSRKASHSLGFFKEGLPEDGLKRRDTKNRGRSKDGLSSATAPSEQDQGRQREGKGTVGREYAATQSSKPTTPFESTHEEDGELSLRTNGLCLSPTEGLTTDEGYFDVTHTIETVAEEELRSMPPQLLAEIRRGHHNLTPGARKGSSFSRSMPMTAAEKSKTEGPEMALEFSRPIREEDEQELKLAELKHVDEEDDSGEEQISSALFVPHQTPHESPEHARNESRDAELSPASDHRRLDRTNSQQWLEEHEVPSDETDEQSIGRDIPVRPPPAPAPSRSQRVLDKLGTNPSAIHDSFEPDQEAPDDEYSTTTGDESSFTDDPDTTPTASVNVPFSQAKQHKVHSIGGKQKPKEPLEAIELIPYKHQVGGHTTMWRFSKRAVCKQLNNRENEFYEQVERYHPKLLHFLPRYIGVLNVTFEKQARRKSHRKGNTGAAAEREKVPSTGDSQDQSNGNPVESGATNSQAVVPNAPEQPRMISQSMHSSSVPIPTVTFANNRHIIPTSFLQPHPHAIDPQQHRSKSDTAAPLATTREQPQSQPPLPDAEFTFRPTLSDKHAASWGATTVNKKLRNEVFGEAFLQQPIPIHRHKRPASQHRSLPHRHGHNLRPSNSESSLKSAQNSQTSSAQPAEESIRRRALKAAAEKRRNGSIESSQEHSCDQANGPNGIAPSKEEEDVDFEEQAGTSAPEPEISRNSGGPQKKPKRRYSSGGLRRKPSKVEEGRGHLKYFEEADDADAGYKGDGEDDVFSMETGPTGAASGLETSAPRDEQQNGTSTETAPPTGGLAKSSAGAPQASGTADISHPQYLDIPRPVNPKEAQTHQGSRVEYFLLLEDLTAGMRRPCIMDLKMGTRQYGVDANEKKQKSQRQKCEATTSQELGVRLCGLQVWDVETQGYVFQDKYFGRSLQAGSQFQEALTRFLYDGVDYTSVLRHIPTILQKLSQLEVIIRGLAGYRFYAASLLMFYDGDVEEEEGTDRAATERGATRKKHEIDFKIADFANCVTKEDLRTVERTCPPRHPELPDKGFLRGLKSLKKYFLAIQREHGGNGVSCSERNHRLMSVVHDGTMEYDTEDEGGISY
ncbi:hypothetical protein BJ875DRAFT_173597 [Amylocarpus encephaloides]|uniref:Kinase n=1 Tax=Amylocarpus encephaloides TaxID=45428 RepID=A0A9P7YBA8_9HELO|nr:hypothetical protein BJ875DRAFT_173597 [Amylocarpus encephaloides]